jgi:hypothetical protein
MSKAAKPPEAFLCKRATIFTWLNFEKITQASGVAFV